MARLLTSWSNKYYKFTQSFLGRNRSDSLTSLSDRALSSPAPNPLAENLPLSNKHHSRQPRRKPLHRKLLCSRPLQMTPCSQHLFSLYRCLLPRTLKRGSVNPSVPEMRRTSNPLGQSRRTHSLQTQQIHPWYLWESQDHNQM
jgi:hypothetical protein